ncbi:MAG: type V CRISPR-associated protein Cas12a/Cpf1, partial [Clostridia bacterium]|nr:type V CRISPR-associated protein Cas12a/Cpf1 [Clostridia bacterium]
MAELFKDFTNLYPVSKTLRFELIPEGETLYYLEKNGVLENDEKRNEDYKKLKKLMDEYYRAYIDEALSNVHLSDLDRYAELYSIQNKSDKEVAEFKKIQQQMRKQIAKFLKEGKDHQYIFKGKLITEILPEFFNDESGSRKEDLDLIKSFKNFTVMCGGFWENRKNMFSAEEKSTAIAYRVVHENLPKFMNNIRIFRLFIDEKVDCSEKLLEKAGVNALSEVFELDYFNNTLSQRGIELYNCILGGFTEDEKHKVQGINELINLHNQQTKEKKIPQLQPLYKQILSDTKSLSFLSDAFENDGEVLATVKALYDEFHEEILSERGLISTTLQNIEKYDSKGIFVKNDLTITGLSNSLFGDWKIINEHLNSWYEENVPRKERTEDKHVEVRKAYFKKLKSISLGFIEEAGLSELRCKYKAFILEKAEAVCDAYKNAEELFDEKLEENCNLITDGKSVEKIKALLDSMKDLEAVILMLSGTGEEAERDELFYGEFEKHRFVLNLLDNVFNKTRNYVTKKPYKTEKIKLTFDSPELLHGWDRNKETSSRSVILMKDGYYYLGIMNKAYNKAFENLKDIGGECYRKMDYKLIPNPQATLPHVFITANKDYYAPDEELLNKYDKKTHLVGDNFNLEDCHALIDYYKASIAKHPEWHEFGFSFSDTSTYRNIKEFYKEVADQGYKIRFRNVSVEYINSLVSEGKLYLFKIYNKDFSPYSKGRPNLHTMYWKALFSDENLENIVYKLNGQAEVFYRKKSIPEDKRVIHPAKEPIAQRRNTDEKSLFDYDIIKDRRYTVDKFQFHVPITMNYTALGSGRINRKMREAIKNCENMHIIGIDRGERHLLYVTVIDMQGNIKE